MSGSGGLARENWIAVAVDLPKHPRFLDFICEVDTDEVTGLGLLVKLWSSAFNLAPDGDLSRWSKRAIGRMTGWRGDALEMCKALIAAGFLGEDLRIHDWESWGGKLYHQRCLASEKQRNYRLGKADEIEPECHGDVTVMSQVCHGYEEGTSSKTQEIEREENKVKSIAPGQTGAAGNDGDSPIVKSLSVKSISLASFPKKEAKKSINKNKSVSMSPDFLSWWAAYGKRGSRADAAVVYGFWRDHGASAADLMTASRNYLADCQRCDRTQKDGATFLAKRPNRWEEWVEPDEKPVAGKKPVCPVCECDLTTDEHGEHCPVCEWRAA